MKKCLRSLTSVVTKQQYFNQQRWIATTSDSSEEPSSNEWNRLITEEMKTIDELEGVMCESRATEMPSVKQIPAEVIQKKKVKITPLEEIKNILSDQQLQLNTIQTQMKQRREEQEVLFEKTFTQLEASIQGINSGIDQQQTRLQNRRTRDVDEIYKQEFKELKNSFEQSKSRLEKSMNRIRYNWEGSPEAWTEFYQSQLAALIKDHKQDVTRLQRTHDRAADDVKSSSEKSNKIILEIMSRQVRQNVGSGVTIGLLLIGLGISLIINYVQLIFIKLNGVPFVLSSVLRYICSRNTRESLPAANSRHMDIMVGMS